MKRNASLREISTFARGSLIGSAITKGFGLRREITFNPKIRQFAFAKSGEPVGSHFARLAAKDLKATRALIARSESHVRNARRESSVLERMALDPNVPLKDVVHMATKLIHRGYFGALDYVFDAKSTIDGLRSRLKITPRNKERVNALLNGQIPLSISGGNVELNFRRKVLLRLANQFSKKEVVSRGGRVSKSIQQQQPFEKYTSEWYRRNYSASG